MQLCAVAAGMRTSGILYVNVMNVAVSRAKGLRSKFSDKVMVY